MTSVGAEAAAAADRARLARSVRVTAILTAVLGAVLAASVALNHALLWLLDAVRRLPAAEPVPTPPLFDFLLAFLEASAAPLLGLGAAFVVGGLWAWRRPRAAPSVLARTAELGVLGMVALGGIWAWVARGHEGALALAAVGLVGHLLQAALIVKAWLFLRRARAALAGGDE